MHSRQHIGGAGDIREATTTGVFIHGGGNNTIRNNVLFNISEGDDSDGNGAWSYSHYWGDWTNRSTHNNVTRNIIAYYNLTNSPAQAVGCPSWGLCTEDTFDRVDYNLYYRFETTESLWAAHPSLTPLGDWSAWKEGGYDRNSDYSNPHFVDPHTNLCLQSDSPAYSLGWSDIPESICSVC